MDPGFGRISPFECNQNSRRVVANAHRNPETGHATRIARVAFRGSTPFERFSTGRVMISHFNSPLPDPSFTMKNILALSLLFAACSASVKAQDESDFDSIKLYTLTNASGAQIKVTNFGAIITAIVVPDRDGKLGDVALGYDRVEDYINAVDKPYFGAIVGRYGNRIAGGEFVLDGETYTLAKNNPPNHLHGGVIGFDKVVWDAEPIRGDDWSGVKLSYLAKDKEEGYPGNLKISVTYMWTDDNDLIVDYEATTDKPTPVNLTQHTYFNLKGEGNGTILDHELMLNAKQFTPVDSTMIPTGEIKAVAETPFDFTTAKPIGRDIAQDNEQLKFGMGFDHNFVLDRSGEDLELAARVYEPSTGRTLEIRTTEPGIQFYCGNFLDGRLKGKSGKPYVNRGGFCLETQHYPDSPNQPSFPSTILKPGSTYETTTVFSFGSK